MSMDEAQILRVVRELAGNYRDKLVGATSAMDAITVLVLTQPSQPSPEDEREEQAFWHPGWKGHDGYPCHRHFSDGRTEWEKPAQPPRDEDEALVLHPGETAHVHFLDGTGERVPLHDFLNDPRFARRNTGPYPPVPGDDGHRRFP